MFIAFLAATSTAATLGGGVTDAEGGALSGVTVYAVDHRLGYATAVTTNDGAWEIENLPAGPYRIWAVPEDNVDHPSRFFPNALAYCDGETQVLAKGGELLGVDLSLPYGGRIEGRVVDASGIGLDGVEVTAEGQNDLQGYRRSAISDAEGHYQIVGLQASESGSGAYTVELEAEGYPGQFYGRVYDRSQSALAEVMLGAVETLEEETLLLGQGVSGQLLSSGEPVAGANVFIYGEGQVLNALSDDEGRFEEFALPPGEVLVWASKEGHALTYYPDADRPEGTLEGAEEGGILEGVDLELPLESALNLSFANGEGDLSGVTVLAYNDTYSVGLGAQSDEKGEIRVGRLHPGDYAVFVYSATEGHIDDFVRDESGEVKWFSVGEEEDEAQAFTMPLGALLEGHVYDEFGSPVYGAQVTAVPEDDTLRSLSDLTNRDGKFSISGVVPGSVTLRASYALYCDDDPGHVTTWWPDARLEERAAVLNLREGEVQSELEVFVSRDDDHDGMGDSWEEANGLDPARNDAGEDADGDGFSNLDEYLLGTDPTSASEDGDCGSCGGKEHTIVWLPLGVWGWRRRRAVD